MCDEDITDISDVLYGAKTISDIYDVTNKAVTRTSELSDKLLFEYISAGLVRCVENITKKCGSIRYVTFRTVYTDEYLRRNRISYGKYDIIPLLNYLYDIKFNNSFTIEVERNLGLTFIFNRCWGIS